MNTHTTNPEDKPYDEQKSWDLVMKAVSRKKRIRAMRWSTAGTALVLALFLVLPILQRKPHSNTVAELPAVHKKATLHLGSGNTIIITDTNKNSLESIASELRPDKRKKVVETTQNVLEIPRGGEYYFRLPDGTEVWLNSASTLEFPSQFTQDTRKVKLEGQAYFDVTHNPDQPFIVETKLGEIEVKGTAFNLNAYPDNPNLSATLVHGKITLHTNNRIQQDIFPGQRAVFTPLNGDVQVEEVDVNLYTSWKDGLFMFQNRTLSDLSIELSRTYDVEFDFKDTQAKNIRYTGQYERQQNLSDVLDLLASTGNIEYTIQKRIISITTRK